LPIKKQLPNKSLISQTRFIQDFLSDQVHVPASLLSNYHQFGINEQELIVLLRLFKIKKDHLDICVKDIMLEFNCTSTEIDPLLSVFLQKGLLNKETLSDDNALNQDVYYLDGLFIELWECWSYQKSCSHNDKSKAVPKTNELKNLPQEQKKVLKHLYLSFEKEFGRGISPMENEKISQWYEVDKMSVEMIEEALKRAVLQGKTSFAYVDRILKNWQDKRFSNLNEVMESDKKFNHNNNFKKSNTPTASASAKEKKQDKYREFFEEALRP